MILLILRLNFIFLMSFWLPLTINGQNYDPLSPSSPLPLVDELGRTRRFEAQLTRHLTQNLKLLLPEKSYMVLVKAKFTRKKYSERTGQVKESTYLKPLEKPTHQKKLLKPSNLNNNNNLKKPPQYDSIFDKVSSREELPGFERANGGSNNFALTTNTTESVKSRPQSRDRYTIQYYWKDILTRLRVQVLMDRSISEETYKQVQTLITTDILERFPRISKVTFGRVSLFHPTPTPTITPTQDVNLTTRNLAEEDEASDWKNFFEKNRYFLLFLLLALISGIIFILLIMRSMRKASSDESRPSSPPPPTPTMMEHSQTKLPEKRDAQYSKIYLKDHIISEITKNPLYSKSYLRGLSQKQKAVLTFSFESQSLRDILGNLSSHHEPNQDDLTGFFPKLKPDALNNKVVETLTGIYVELKQYNKMASICEEDMAGILSLMEETSLKEFLEGRPTTDYAVCLRAANSDKFQFIQALLTPEKVSEVINLYTHPHPNVGKQLDQREKEMTVELKGLFEGNDQGLFTSKKEPIELATKLLENTADNTQTLTTIKGVNPELYHQLQGYQVTFDDLVANPNGEIIKYLGKLDNNVLAMAIYGLEAQHREALLNLFSRTKRDLIKGIFLVMGPYAQRENIEEAQIDIIRDIRKGHKNLYQTLLATKPAPTAATNNSSSSSTNPNEAPKEPK
jgi:flagellar motor switch protein FliG